MALGRLTKLIKWEQKYMRWPYGLPPKKQGRNRVARRKLKEGTNVHFV